VADNKAAVDVTEPLTLLTPVTEGAVPVEWDHATIVDLTVADLEREPAGGAQFATLPVAAGKAKQYGD
jgi:hypothetical protein